MIDDSINRYICESKPNNHENEQKKGDFENPKVPNCYFSAKLVPDQCGFSNSAVCCGPKHSTNRGPPEFDNSKPLVLYGFVGQKCHNSDFKVNIKNQRQPYDFFHFQNIKKMYQLWDILVTLILDVLYFLKVCPIL